MAAVEQARIRVIGDGLLGEATIEALHHYGVRPEKAEAPRDIADFTAPDAADATEATVVALDTEQPQVLDAINAWALRVRAPWLLLSAGGFNARVGPLFMSRETACYACHRARLDGNVSSYDRYIRVMAPIRDPTSGSVASMTGRALSESMCTPDVGTGAFARPEM